MTIIQSIGQFFGYILPVVGTVLGIFLIILVKKLIDTLQQVDKTIEGVNDQIKKLDAPLNTVGELCGTIDDVHHKIKDSVKQKATQYKQGKEKLVGTVQPKADAFKKRLKDINEAKNNKLQSAKTAVSTKKEDLTKKIGTIKTTQEEKVQSVKTKVSNVYSKTKETIKSIKK